MTHTREQASAIRTAGTEQAHINNRPERIPLHEQKNILSIDNCDKAFVYRWVLDTVGRVDRFKLAGWEHVIHSLQVGDSSVNSSEQKGGIKSVKDKSGITLYLMRISKDWYDIDQQNKQNELNAQERQMYEKIQNKEGFYGKVEVEFNK